jgi:hypothetical protein
MSKLIIMPTTALLTAGQAVTFEATNADGQTLSVNWSLHPTSDGTGNPEIGELVPAVTDAQSPSATYIAPKTVSTSQTISVVGSTANGSASAMISLTTMAIVPPKADLMGGQAQKFIAIDTASSADSNGTKPDAVTWILSPPYGDIEQETGLYTAPRDIPESTEVSVIATTSTPGKHAVAAVTLVSTPWQGIGVTLLGVFILSVFFLVAIMIGLWPPALPSPETAKANRIEAEATLRDKADALQQAEAAVAAAPVHMDNGKKPTSTGTTAKAKGAENTASPEVPNAKAVDAAAALRRAQDAWDEANQDLQKKRNDEQKVNGPDVDTKLVHCINRELDMLCLVLLAGSLGSFLHMAQSYSDFIGNRTIKSSWAWWYSLRPFIGAGLALVFYCAVRGGFLAIASGSTTKASDLNPFGVVSIAAMVGMFSEAATTKLGEVFDTLFKSDKAQQSKDKLVPPAQPPGQPPAKAGARAVWRPRP